MDIQQNVFDVFEVPDPIRIKKVARILRGLLSGVMNKNILELGVVKGGLADTFQREGAHCYGVDINPRTLNGVTIKQADLNEGVPDFGMKFDVVFGGEVMEHIFDEGKFLDGINACLNEGGYIALTVPNLTFGVNRVRMLFGMTPKFVFEPYHYHIYTKKVLESLLRDHGFEIKKIISSHVLFSTRKSKIGIIFEKLGDIFPTFGAHLIVVAQKR